ISLYEFKGKKFFELLILSPIIIPMISVAMGIQLVFIKFGIANTLTGVILINIIPCIPYGVRIIADVYKLIGAKYEIQASMLGAKKIDTLRYVTIPLILPGIIGASSMCFIISFSQYFLTLLIGGGSVITYPLLMFPYIQSGDRILASMYSIVFIIISLIVVMLMKKSLEKYYNKEN
ncbi:MAG: ABC transporter permease subunit, partial [Clostridiales bacterium]|nr:ABC transporter permease subunit [Clostridiales bacterium]